jgi:hypothetical protein
MCTFSVDGPRTQDKRFEFICEECVITRLSLSGISQLGLADCSPVQECSFTELTSILQFHRFH